MDADVLEVEPDERGRLHGPAVSAALAPRRTRPSAAFAVVATAGTTNVAPSTISSAWPRRRRGDLWFHVDGAYGGAGLVAPSVRPRYDGIERADSFVVALRLGPWGYAWVRPAPR